VRLAAARAPFDGWTLVVVSGRHSERYLQSQLTSDLGQLPDGGSQLSAVLDATGRIRGFFHLNRHDGAFRMLVPDGAVESALDGLETNVVSDDVRFEPLDVGPMTLVLGPAAEQIRLSRPATSSMPISGYGAPAVVVWGDGELPFPVIQAEELESRRVLSGLPAWGVDAGSGMLINETVLLEQAVAFDKGCFLGQETVAKVASRRGAAFAPMLLALGGDADPGDDLVGRDFAVGDRGRAGTVRAAASWEGRSYLQASLWRELRVAGSTVSCCFDDGTEVTAEVRSLPLLVTPGADETASRLYHRAVNLFTGDDEDGAIELLERAITISPGFADAYESLGVVLGRHGRYEEAIALMDRLLEVDPDSVMAHSNKSVYLNQLGRNDEAEEEARRAARAKFDLDRQRRQAETASVGAADDAGRADRRRREEMFRQVLEIDPDDAMANFGLGQLALERAEHQAAVTYLERALETDSEYSAAFLALGRALEGLGEAARARETYASGVRVAARKGDMKTANAMQERLAVLGEAAAGAIAEH
jgi:folate-binding protein YgfZ